MAEIEIQHDETEQQHITRMAGGELRELLGKLARDLIGHGVMPDQADHAVAHLFAGMTMMDEKEGASIAMVLQSLRNVHRKPWSTLMRSAAHMSPHDFLSCALHNQHEALMALMGVIKHPETPKDVARMATAAARHIEKNLRLIQDPFWATQEPDATDMEPAGNA